MEFEVNCDNDKKTKDFVKKLFQKTKETLKSQMIQLIANSKLKRYGTLLNIKIDSKNQELFLEAELKGETEPIEIHVQEYELFNEQGQDYIRINRASTSKEWLNYLFEDYLAGQKYKISAKAVTLLNRIFN